jgi:FlaA1/EpsC-like NDP-sugar epimerase
MRVFNSSPCHGSRRALIVANPTTEALACASTIGKRRSLDLVGFVGDRGFDIEEFVGGLPVFRGLDQIGDLARHYAVSEILLRLGELPSDRAGQVISECRESDIRVSLLPGSDQLVSRPPGIKSPGIKSMATKPTVINPKGIKPGPISGTDLLRRKPVTLDSEQIHSWLEGRTVMVTGSAGSIGREICSQLLQFRPSRLIAVDRWEYGQFQLERELRDLAPNLPVDVCLADVADAGRMNRLFVEQAPEILVHAAAYKHVPMMETNAGEAIKNNVLATCQLADLADEFGLQAFVLISTDKAVNPTSVMGTSKRVVELYTQSLAQTSACRFVTVRFGNVLDSTGSAVPIFREQIARGGPITVTDPRMTRFFMLIPEAAQLVIQAGAMGRGGEIFVLDMGEPVRILDLAYDMIRLAGLRFGHDIDIQFIGLRPGEKLFEELRVHGEIHQPTWHPNIRGAIRTAPLVAAEIAAGVERLGDLVDAPSVQIIAELQRIVPEYRPESVIRGADSRIDDQVANRARSLSRAA